MKTDAKLRLIALLLAAACVINATSFTIPTTNADDNMPEQLVVTVYSSYIDPNDTNETVMTFEEYMSEQRNPADIITFVSNGNIDGDDEENTDYFFKIEDGYHQLGELGPFTGQIKINTAFTVIFSGEKALFKELSDSVQPEYIGGLFDSIKFKRTYTTGYDSALLADKLVHDNNYSGDVKEWKVEVFDSSKGPYCGVFGEIDKEAKIKLNFTDNSDAIAGSINNVGTLCGVLGVDATLDVEELRLKPDKKVKSVNGAAGGLVGVMLSGSQLILENGFSGSSDVRIENFIIADKPTPVDPPETDAQQSNAFGMYATNINDSIFADESASDNEAEGEPAENETPDESLAPAAESGENSLPANDESTQESSLEEDSAEEPVAQDAGEEEQTAPIDNPVNSELSENTEDTTDNGNPTNSTSEDQSDSNAGKQQQDENSRNLLDVLINAAFVTAFADDDVSDETPGSTENENDNPIDNDIENLGENQENQQEGDSQESEQEGESQESQQEGENQENQQEEENQENQQEGENQENQQEKENQENQQEEENQENQQEGENQENQQEEENQENQQEEENQENQQEEESQENQQEGEGQETQQENESEQSVTPETIGYVGGLVGAAVDAKISLGENKTIDITGTVLTGANPGGAGGVFGYYERTAETYNAEVWANPDVFDLKDYTINITISGGANSGGVFGALYCKGDYEILKSSASKTLAVTFTGGTEKGGVIGYYKNGSLTNTLKVHDLQQTVTGNAKGGVIGTVDNSPAYISVYDLSVTTSSTVNGGIIGDFGTGDSFGGSFLDISGVVSVTGGTFNGGIIDQMGAGVLRLAGNTTVNATTTGQIVKSRKNGLIYALGNGENYTAPVLDADVNITTPASGWTLNRGGTRYGDVGDWGEVVRPAAFANDVNGDVLTYDGEAHTVTIADATPSAINDPISFARTALNIQFNVAGQPDDGALQFTDGDANKSATLLGSESTLTLTGSFSLVGTGLTGFTRDNGDQIFTGTLAGGGYNITLATGEGYGDPCTVDHGASDGNGEIFNHSHVGLFGVVNGATISNLTLNDGSIDYVRTDNGTTYIGGLAAEETGDLTLTGVTVSPTITYNASSGTMYVGGAVGCISNAATFTTTESAASSFSAAITEKGTANNNYNGGVIGYVTGNSGTTVTIQNDTIAGTYTKDTAGTYARFGGAIGYVSKASSGKTAIIVTGATVGALTISPKISANNRVTTGVGGALGYIWNAVDAEITTLTLNGLTINANTADNSNKNVGGLLYRASGKMHVNGVTVTSATFNGATSSFGFAVNDCFTYDNNGNRTDALYLVVENSNYNIAAATVTNSPTVYDEIAAYSLRNGTQIENNGQAVVSIELANDAKVQMDGAACNTYQNKITAYATKTNPNTRYYYNIEDIIAKIADTEDTENKDPEKLMLWSLDKYAHSTIRSNFAGGFTDTGITGTLDMNGYSYYPVDVSHTDVTVSNATIKFYNSEIEAGERGTGNTDVHARGTLDDNGKTQHYLMHTALLNNYNGGGEKEYSILLVNATTLQGNVGIADGQSGFLVRGTLGGTLGTTYFGIDATWIKETKQLTPGASDWWLTLDGAVVSNELGPLLVNEIAKNTTTSINGVKTSAEYKYSENATELTMTAATSLLGKVGGVTVNDTNIGITFSRIVLDARASDNAVSDATAKSELDAAYHTTKSIFSVATLMTSFDYKDNISSGVYNYVLSEDYPASGDQHQVTYGVEVNDSRQDCYYDRNAAPKLYTNPISSAEGATKYSDFSNTGKWMRYVGDDKTVLQVNRLAAVGGSGCGEVNDPYIITSYDDLLTYARIIAGTKTDGTINLPYNGIDTPENPTDCVEGTETEKHALYTITSTNCTTSESVANPLYSYDNVRKYLAGAYYKITNSFTIPADSGFPGLGALIDNLSTFNNDPFAFRGTILGGNETITNESSNPLIMVSNGARVENLSIVVNANITLTGDSGKTQFNYNTTSNMPSYGAVIGQVMGGDTLLNRVYVNFQGGASVTVNGTNPRLIPVGGYIGVLLNGTVVFQNSVSDLSSTFKVINTSDSDDLVTNEGWLYVNPIIGRVIAGHAFSEGEDDATVAVKNYFTVDDEKVVKNYDVPQLKKKIYNAKLVVDSSSNKKITVANAQNLWVLGAIVNSGAGAFDGTAYADINTSTAWQGWRQYCAARGDGVEFGANDKVPYIIANYTDFDSGNNKDARTVSSSDDWKVEIKGNCNFDNLPGFRGIGTIYIVVSETKNGTIITKSDNALSLRFTEIKGVESPEIKYNMRYLEYDVTTSGENYKAFDNAGFGLINNMVSDNAIIKDFTIAGTIWYDKYRADTGALVKGNKTSISDRDFAGDNAPSALSVGGVLGRNNGKNLTINNVKFSDELTIHSIRYGGGLVGISVNTLTVENCGSLNGNGVVTIEAGYAAAGLVGRSFRANLTVKADSLTDLHVNSISRFNRVGDSIDFQGGGIVGYQEKNGNNGSSISIQNMRVIGGEINDHSSSTNENNAKSYAAGILGSTFGGPAVTIDNCHLVGTSINGGLGSGGIAGKLQGGSANISNVSVTTEASQEIEGAVSAGGIVGRVKENSCPVTIENAVVSGYTIKSSGNATLSCAGGIIGTTQHTSTLKNNLVKNCEIISEKKQAGGIIGRIDNGKGAYEQLGYNILLNDVTYGTTGTKGVVAGSKAADGAVLKIVGLSVQYSANTEQAKRVYGKVGGRTDTATGTSSPYGSTGYVVFADYTGASVGMTSMADPGIIIPHNNDVENLRSKPFVTVNPVAALSSLYFTSDGVGYETVTDNNGKNTYTTVAQMILSDPDGKSKYALAESVVDFSKYSDIVDSYTATYKARVPDYKGPDFPIFILNNTVKSQAHDQINNYLRLLTNTSYNFASTHSDESSIFAVDRYRVKLVPSTGAVQSIVNTEDEVSLKVETDNASNGKGNKFYMTSTCVDNDDVSFTLLDVKFFDPSDTNTNKIAYHLYVPILVEETLPINLVARPLAGTNYVKDDTLYNSQYAVENGGTPITVLMKYSYDRTQAKWIEVLSSGMNLKENYNKVAGFKLSGGTFDDDTQLTLVDPATRKTYYSTVGDAVIGNVIDFSKFKSTLDDGETAETFSPVPLYEVLDITVHSTEETGGNIFAETSPVNATFRAKDAGGTYHWLKPYESGDSGSKYEISAIGVNNTEDYFLTIYTPVDDTIISCTIDAVRLQSNADLTPTEVKRQSSSAAKNDQANFVVGKVYEITTKTLVSSGGTTDNTHNNVRIVDPANGTVTAKMISTIKMNDQELYKSFSPKMYHSFIVLMTKSFKDDSGNRVTVSAISGPASVSGKYSVVDGETTTAPESYDETYLEPNNTHETWSVSGDFAQFITNEPLDFTGNTDTYTVMAEACLSYSNEAAIAFQFPEKPADQDEISKQGTVVSARSNIASTQGRTTFSHVTSSMEDTANLRYYSEVEIKEAHLYYNPAYVDESNHDRVQLGINPKDPIGLTSSYVQTVGVLDYLDIIDQANDWDTAVITWSLEQKNKPDLPYKYDFVRISDFLTEVKIGGKDINSFENGDSSLQILENGSKIVLTVRRSEIGGVYNTIIDSFGELTVPIEFNVITGSVFEEAYKRYANYKVNLVIELKKGDEQKALAREEPFVVYTNAKIYPNFI